MDSYQAMWDAIPHIQLYFSCQDCGRRYQKGWIQASETMCLFCRSYPSTDGLTRSKMIRDGEWVYIQTGYEDIVVFYAEYLNQIHRWADAMGIAYTGEDIKKEEDLRREIMEIVME